MSYAETQSVWRGPGSVLYLDTEKRNFDQIDRLTAFSSDVGGPEAGHIAPLKDAWRTDELGVILIPPETSRSGIPKLR